MPYEPKTASDIERIYGQLETRWATRARKVTQHRDLARQIDFRQRLKSPKRSSFEGNESGTFFSVMVQILSKNPARHPIPFQRDSEEDRILKGQVERLLQGTYREVDIRRGRRLNSGSLQQVIAQFLCADGWANLELKYNPEGAFGGTKPLIDIREHDTLDVMPDWDGEGLAHVIIMTRRTKEQVAGEYPKLSIPGYQPGVYSPDMRSEGGTTEKVYTTYYRGYDGKVYYGVAYSGQWAIEPYPLDWCDGVIPVIVLPVNGLPFRSFDHGFLMDSSWTLNEDLAKSPDQTDLFSADDWTGEAGRGVFHMNEQLYPLYNNLWAKVMDLISQESKNTYIKYTEGGDDSELTVGQGADAVNPMKVGEKFERVQTGQLTPHMSEAIGAIYGMLQRGGVNQQLLGQAIGSDQSGFAISQLITTALYTATPYVLGIESVYRQLDDLVIRAYTYHGANPPKTGTQLRYTAMFQHNYVEEEFDLAQLANRTFFVDVDVQPGLPDDLASRLQAAMLAKRDDLLDEWTILDDIIKIDDPELVLQRKDEAAVLNLPQVRMRRMAAQFLQQGRKAEAAAVIQELLLLMQTKQLQAGQVQAQLLQLEQLLGQAQGNPGGMPGAGADVNSAGIGGMGPGGGAPPPQQAPNVQPGSETGLLPQQMPPQMSGMSPERARLMAADMMKAVGG